MLAPLSWLKDYVDIDITPQELEDKLFSCGFEVEELYEMATGSYLSVITLNVNGLNAPTKRQTG